MEAGSLLSTFLLVIVMTLRCVASVESDVTATCVINKDSGSQPIEGYINFTQPASSEIVTVHVYVTGFNDTGSQHGFHVHASGNLSEKCNAAGGHFNPYNVVHGGPASAITNRHVGDLGNVMTDSNGVVNTTITDNVISLINTTRLIINKAIVVHSGEDDLGLGTWPDSNTTGHAGVRYGCCVITAVTGGTTTTTTIKPTGTSSTIHCNVLYITMTSLLLTLKQLLTVL